MAGCVCMCIFNTAGAQWQWQALCVYATSTRSAEGEERDLARTSWISSSEIAWPGSKARGLMASDWTKSSVGVLWRIFECKSTQCSAPATTKGAIK